MSLTVNDFSAFHKAVHGGHAPFEWQCRLLRQIVNAKQWPRTLDLPTGSGKTTCIDIALFALALDAGSPPQKRWCPRRIAMVVDRRVVVDQAAERGYKLLTALTTSSNATVIKVREALALLSEEKEPMGVFTLRGGIPKDDGWARTPDQPLVIASTVDQLGSRLLIQGYGVTRGMRPVHAGLIGNDMLILLDEVHLSQPFKQTLERLGALRERFTSNCLPRRFQFAFLSATTGEETSQKFGLDPAELKPDSALGPRLYAKKPARIVNVSGREEVASCAVREAKALIKQHQVIATVVNRVDTALAVFARLKEELKEGVDIVLLTGRMRPLDRDDVLAQYRSRLATGLRMRTGDETKLVVIGTQCIEAGADFDFDALITESASFDALRQRFGRLDRLGIYKDAAGMDKAEGVIVHDETAEIEKRDKAGKLVRKDGQIVMVSGDPIYGDTIVKTMKWLMEKAKNKKGKKGKSSKTKSAQEVGEPPTTIDFGSRSLLDAPSELFSPKADAPILLPAYLDLWSQTAPEPTVVPEPGLFLHGPQSGPEDVQVVWRTDLDEASFGSQSLSNLIAAVGAVPPSSLEAISLPFIAVRRWLAGKDDVLHKFTDLEIKAATGNDEQEIKPAGKRALRWQGNMSEVVDAAKIRPGDTLIVPANYGGVDLHAWSFNPNATENVPDLAERASLMGRGRPLLRLHPQVVAKLGLALNVDDPKAARSKLTKLVQGKGGWMELWAEWLAAGRTTRAVSWSSEENDGWTVISGERVRAGKLRQTLNAQASTLVSVEDGIEATTDDEESSFLGSEVELGAHSQHVEEKARNFARRLGLSDEFANDLALSAFLHDIGKADRRFQCLLRGGSEIDYYRDEGRVLAKSCMAAGSKAEHLRALQASGYPKGTRHEVQSLAMIESIREQLHAENRAHDLDLVMHLVASHHGYCRPFAPVAEDHEPVEVALESHKSAILGNFTFPPTTSANELCRLDSPLADRFWSLVEKYGWLELCWLEAILRLADHRASEDESR